MTALIIWCIGFYFVIGIMWEKDTNYGILKQILNLLLYFCSWPIFLGMICNNIYIEISAQRVASTDDNPAH